MRCLNKKTSFAPLQTDPPKTSSLDAQIFHERSKLVQNKTICVAFSGVFVRFLLGRLDFKDVTYLCKAWHQDWQPQPAWFDVPMHQMVGSSLDRFFLGRSGYTSSLEGHDFFFGIILTLERCLENDHRLLNDRDSTLHVTGAPSKP